MYSVIKRLSYNAMFVYLVYAGVFQDSGFAAALVLIWTLVVGAAVFVFNTETLKPKFILHLANEYRRKIDKPRAWPIWLDIAYDIVIGATMLYALTPFWVVLGVVYLFLNYTIFEMAKLAKALWNETPEEDFKRMLIENELEWDNE